MKLCVISPSFFPAHVYGGPILSIHNTCKSLADKGVEVFVSTTNANGKTKLDVKTNKYLKFSDNYFVKYYDDTIIGRFSWQFCLNVHNDIRQSSVVKLEDIFSTYIPISLFFCWLYKTHTIISVRGVFSNWALGNKKRFLKRIWIALFIKPFEKKILWHATSHAESNDVLRLFPDAKVVVIPNGINLEDHKTSCGLTRSEYLSEFGLNFEDNTEVIVSMGRLHKVKAFDLLIRAFHSLIQERPKAVLLIAGDDDGVGEELELLIDDLSLKGYVFLIGHLDGRKKSIFMSGADVFAMTSYSENFGNVYLEAMASGTPILSSIGTPWTEVNSFGCGECADFDINNIKNYLEKILSGDLEKMGNNAVDYARKFTWSEVANQFQSCFDIHYGEY